MSVANDNQTYQPVATTNAHGPGRPAIAEGEHIQFPFLDDHEHIEPVLRLRSLAGHLPVLLPAKHTFFGPRGTEQREFFIRNTDARRVRLIASYAPVIVFLSLTDDRVR